MESVIAIYPKTEGVLYSITGMVCQSCINNLAVFANFKNKYTLAFVNGILKASDEAQAMPNNSSRQATKKSKRKALVVVNDTLCVKMELLLKYTEESFDESQVAEMKQLAGAAYYKKAIGMNWEASTTMFGMAEDFMGTYAKELAGGGLPDGFADEFSKDADGFTDALKSFLDSKNAVEVDGAAKTTANNALYTRLQGVMEDGRYLFKGDAALQKQFSYNALMKKAAGPGKTGCRIALKEVESLLPVEKATIALQPGNHQISSNKKGIYKEEIPAGTYSLLITAPGFTLVEGSITISAGVTRHEKFILTPAVTNTGML